MVFAIYNIGGIRKDHHHQKVVNLEKWIVYNKVLVSPASTISIVVFSCIGIAPKVFMVFASGQQPLTSFA